MKRLLYFVLALAALLPAKALAQDIEVKTDTIIDQPVDQPADLTIDQPGRRYTSWTACPAVAWVMYIWNR